MAENQGLFEEYFNKDAKELKALNKETFKKGMQLRLQNAANNAEDAINRATGELNSLRASLTCYDINAVVSALDRLRMERARLEDIRAEYVKMFGVEIS
jgi:predicted PilT family ATPase